MKKIRFVTDLYGLAAILVVFGHSHPLHTEYPQILHDVINFLYTFHMPLFFIVAGILLAYTAPTRKDNILAWWKKKCAKLFLPYLVLTLLAWIPKTVLNQYMNDDMEISFINLIKIILIPRSGIWGHFWFVPVYLVLILLGAYWINEREHTSRIVNIGIMFVAVIFNLLPISVTWFGIEDITQNFLYILIGIMFSNFIIQKQNIKYGFIKGMTGMLVALIVYFSFQSEFSKDLITEYLSVGILIDRLTCLLMIYSMLCFGLELAKHQVPWLDYIGNHAFTIYIYSWPIQAVLEMIFNVVLKVDWKVGYLVMFFGGLLGPLAIWEIYSKTMKRNVFLDAMIGVK